jgi:hypothetical protein
MGEQGLARGVEQMRFPGWAMECNEILIPFSPEDVTCFRNPPGSVKGRMRLVQDAMSRMILANWSADPETHCA